MISTTDPITLRDVPDTWGRPYVVEGGHYSDITIYFESEETRQAYLDIEVEHPGRDLTVNLDNPTDDTIDAN
jgi:hypothetical protein